MAQPATAPQPGLQPLQAQQQALYAQQQQQFAQQQQQQQPQQVRGGGGPSLKKSSRPQQTKKGLSAETMLHEWSTAVVLDAAEQLTKAHPSTKVEDPGRVASELAVQVEARLRSTLAEARLRTWGRRGDVMSVEDLNGALEARGEDRCLGQPTTKGRSTNQGRRLPSREIDLKKRLASAKTPPAPPEPSVALHWLAIDGVQPDVPENDLSGQKNLADDSLSAKNLANKKNNTLAMIQSHPGVTKEHELYVQRVVSATRDAGAADDVAQREVFRSLRRDDGLATVAPAIIAFCCAEATAAKKRTVASLRAAVAAMRALALNPRARVEAVLHDLLPAALTLVVAKRLGNEKQGLDHFDLRRDAARCVADVCFEFGDKYQTLRPRVAQTYADALKDTTKPLAVTFGAIAGVEALGPLAVAKLLVPRATDLAKRFAAAPTTTTTTTNDDADDKDKDKKKASSRTRQHQADMATRLTVDALAVAVAQNYLRPLVLTYVERSEAAADNESAPPTKKRRRRLAQEDDNSLRRRRSNIEGPAIDLELLDTFGETLVPFCATIPSSIFL